MAWPTASDVVTAFDLQGLECNSAEATFCLDAAVDRFEELTYRPFLASASGDWYFDPVLDSDGLMVFGTAVFTTISAVRMNLTPTDSSGTLLVSGTDYDLWPYNAVLKDRPFMGLRFRSLGWSSDARSMKVTGIAGWATTIPAAVWLAIRDEAMAQALLRIIEGYSMVSEVAQGPVKFKYDNDEGRSKIDRMHKNFMATIAKYQRVHF